MTARRRPSPAPAAFGAALIAIGAATDVRPLLLAGLGFNATYLLGWLLAGRR